MGASKNIAALFTAIVFFAISGCAQTRVAMSEGDRFAASGAWDDAAVKYGEVLKNEPDNVEYRIKYLRAKGEAAATHYDKGVDYLGKADYDNAISEFRTALMLDPGLKKSGEAIKKAANLKDSEYQYDKGMEFLRDNKKKEAQKSFKQSLKLNPLNSSAKAEIEKLKRDEEVVMDGYGLDIKSGKPITLEFKDASVKRIFEGLSKLSGINFVFDADVKDVKSGISLHDATFKQALDLLLSTSGLSKKVVSENTIVVYPSTPQKEKQYQELMIKVFYLTDMEAKHAVNLLRTMLKAGDIYVYEDLNAIVIRAKPDVIDLAQKILDATDRSDSEVVLAVDILEINRNKAQNLGINLDPAKASLSVPQGGINPITGASFTAGILLGDLANLTSKDLLATLPSAILNMKMEDLDADILANPRIRVKNKEKAKIHIGERVPIITSTVNNGVTTENVQYQDVGLKLNVEPRIKPNDEIDLKISLEVSSLGTKTTTTSGSVVYQIGTRNAETFLSLNDGETQIIGGLINDEERTTTLKIPGLGNIPIIGKIFSSTDKSKVKTDILLSITPHIIRRLDMPDEETTRIWSGREDSPSLGQAVDVSAPRLDTRERPALPQMRDGRTDFPPPPPPSPPGFPPPPPPPGAPESFAPGEQMEDVPAELIEEPADMPPPSP
ncbi:MAG TPA: secretin and TonB N-terminal domain-containing protein [Thermodesulfobacteriota bacterium]|nr:secretin and TonB N-terminal domain-containing protein [Thermodesulfobacteriota bacterium]